MVLRISALFIALSIFGGGSFVPVANGAEGTSPAQTIWQLLDYIAVDYPGAIADGKIINEIEYAEMVEFAGSAQLRMLELPATDALPGLISEAEQLRAGIAQKLAPADVAAIAHQLADNLLVAYPVPLAPASPPDPDRAAALYSEQCAGCHGIMGRGDGPLSLGLEPAPTAFTDRARARERSIFGLYQVVEQGLDGTAMASFDALTPDDRWGLAFYVGGLAYSPAEIDAGAALWADDPALATIFPDLEAVTRSTPAALVEKIGEENAVAMTAYLRHHPEAAIGRVGGSLVLAKARLAESLTAYRSGDHSAARDLALSAYLDGFEPVEPAVALRDGDLMLGIESAMIELRARIGRNASDDDVAAQTQEVLNLLDRAERVLDEARSDSGASFIGAFTILLREGLEALLIVVAMIAFLNKADRREVLPYVHGGWLVALLAGVLTWAVATRFITISGAGRELTEGIGALIAAIVLVSVGIWMHGKSHADAWQKYIGEKMSHALSRQSAWFLFSLAFIVVYREVFETILFFMALWSQGNAVAIIAGSGAAVAALALITWAMLAYSKRLPIAQFFYYSSLLIAVLAVVLAGKGIAALQEAGWLGIQPVAGLPRVELLGIFPTMEGAVAQVLTLAILVIAFWLNNRKMASGTTT